MNFELNLSWGWGVGSGEWMEWEGEGGRWSEGVEGWRGRRWILSFFDFFLRLERSITLLMICRATLPRARQGSSRTIGTMAFAA